MVIFVLYDKCIKMEKGVFIMPLAQTKVYTEADYYNLPEDVRAELIEGNLIYNQAAPSRIHQTILM